MYRASQWVCQPTRAAPALARKFVVDHLEKPLAGTATLSDAALVVSELVTNAINAGSSRIIVDIDLHHDHLTLAVSDDAPGQPHLQTPAQLAIHGRGLQIINSIATQWGTDLQPPGKRVWAHLPVDPSDATSRHPAKSPSA
jgi:two-component sensor histidine kinase